MSKIRFDKKINLQLVLLLAAVILLLFTLTLSLKNLYSLFKPVTVPDTALSPQQQVLDQALSLLESLNQTVE